MLFRPIVDVVTQSSKANEVSNDGNGTTLQDRKCLAAFSSLDSYGFFSPLWPALHGADSLVVVTDVFPWTSKVQKITYSFHLKDLGWAGLVFLVKKLPPDHPRSRLVDFNRRVSVLLSANKPWGIRWWIAKVINIDLKWVLNWTRVGIESGQVNFHIALCPPCIDIHRDVSVSLIFQDDRHSRVGRT